MPLNRPYLLPDRYVFPEHPPELPFATDNDGLTEYIVRAEIVERGDQVVKLRGETQAGSEVRITVSLVMEEVARVLLETGVPDTERIRLAGPSIVLGSSSSHLDGGVIRLQSSGIIVCIQLDPFGLGFFQAGGKVLLKQNYTHRDATDRLSLLPFGFTRIDDRQVAFHDSFSLAPDEHFYGFGEKFNNFDKRGLRMEMWAHNIYGMHNEQSYKNVPFFLSTQGYGVFVDSATCTRFDMGASNQAVFSMIVPDTALDYYVITGPDLKTIITRYAGLVGFPQDLPKWAFGLWMSSSFGPDNAEKTLNRARRLREEGIPCDVIHLDCFWQKDQSWSDLEWDRENFPDPQGLIRRLKAMGFKVCLWENPYVSIQSDKFQGLQSQGFFLKDQAGQDYILDLWDGFQPPVGILDFTNPQAKEWFKDAHRPLIRMGVDVFEPDFGESVPFDAVAHNGMTGERLHNLYPLLYNDAIREVMREETGRYLLWGRSSFTGGQRHAIQWGADCDASFQSMAGNLRGGLSIGISGHPFWSHDIGGFTGTPSPELYIRWAQFGMLSPISRPHGVTTRLPWEFGDRAKHIFREYTRLRYSLLPYLYRYGCEATRTSLPMLRAMLLEFPDDPATYHLDLQYMLGAEMMVAPVYNESGRRPVYFPKGKWVDFWTHEIIEGPQTCWIDFPLDVLPLYIRAGALIPRIDAGIDFIPEAPFGFVTFEGFFYDRASFELADIDGQTTASAAIQEDMLEIRLEGSLRRAGFRIYQLEGMPDIKRVQANGSILPYNEGVQLDKDSPPGWKKDQLAIVLVV